MTPPKTRNRQPKPAWTHTGINAELWRADSARLLWAQTSPQFNELVSILINDRDLLLLPTPGTTENMQLGEERGYAKALRHLRSLAIGPTPPSPPMPPQNYEPDTEVDSDPAID